MDWTADKADVARNHLKRMWSLVGPTETQNASEHLPQEFVDALANDLDTHTALQLLIKWTKEGRADDVTAAAHLLGFLCVSEAYDALFDEDWLAEETVEAIEEAIFQWHLARQQRDFSRADKMRGQLLALGIRPVSQEDENSNWVFSNPDFMSDNDNARIIDGIEKMRGEAG